MSHNFKLGNTVRVKRDMMTPHSGKTGIVKSIEPITNKRFGTGYDRIYVTFGEEVVPFMHWYLINVSNPDEP